jgi:hypothetical protein
MFGLEIIYMNKFRKIFYVSSVLCGMSLFLSFLPSIYQSYTNAQCIKLAPNVSSIIPVPVATCNDATASISGTHNICVLQGLSMNFRGGNSLTGSSFHVQRVGSTNSWQVIGHTGNPAGCTGETGTAYVMCLDWN